MTLVELLVVLGIIGLIVGISVPGLAGYAARLRLRTASRQAVRLLSLARSLAISSREPHAVVVDAEQRQLRIVNLASGDALEAVVRLPTSVSLELSVGGEPSTEEQLVFHPTGSLASRSVSLVFADREQRQTITVTGATGAITIQ